ncbi:transcription factor IIA, alpha/beta subunit [Coprinopsis sp. MPI-PUGE-AT-0042]|nr:transcription factor IIA, alpha/beta subunit [Coprinopsis sp. MPI-PUGE-AT-0042]
MSNKIVPNIYRSVIDDVIASIKSEFDEFGVSEDVLAELQNKWETKVIQSHVAEFEPPAQPAAPQPVQQHPQPIHQSYPPHPMHMMQTHPHYAHPYGHMAAAPVPAPSQPTVKTEPNDNAARYLMNAYPGAALTPLPGPNLAAARPPTLPPHPGGQTTAYSVPRPLQTQYPATVTHAARPAYSPPQPAAPGQTAQRIPQVDGPSESSDDEGSQSPPPAFAPRTNHPSLPQPVAAQPRQRTPGDSEAINSDLDDSDTEGEEEADEGGANEPDIVFCTYDKVARVKNKWKCILKDGMIHVNGKDYLFAKCTGYVLLFHSRTHVDTIPSEFEW